MVFVLDGEPLATISDFKNADFELMMRRLEEEYLGQTAKQYDDILDGMKVTCEVHIEDQQIFRFLQGMIDRSSRRNTSLKINLNATINMPNGDRPKIYCNNLFFNAVPISVPGRSDYVALKLDGACSSPRFVLSA